MPNELLSFIAYNGHLSACAVCQMILDVHEVQNLSISVYSTSDYRELILMSSYQIYDIGN